MKGCNCIVYVANDLYPLIKQAASLANVSFYEKGNVVQAIVSSCRCPDIYIQACTKASSRRRCRHVPNH